MSVSTSFRTYRIISDLYYLTPLVTINCTCKSLITTQFHGFCLRVLVPNLTWWLLKSLTPPFS